MSDELRYRVRNPDTEEWEDVTAEEYIHYSNPSPGWGGYHTDRGNELRKQQKQERGEE